MAVRIQAENIEGGEAEPGIHGEAAPQEQRASPHTAGAQAPEGDQPPGSRGEDLDYREAYNTRLPQRDEARFQMWLNAQSDRTGRDVAQDLYDYDLRGWWSRNQDRDLDGAHLTDTYKKPNHPTFSDESRYHGIEGLSGGTWRRNTDGSWEFRPGTTNLRMHGTDQLQRYFEERERGNRLVLPQREGAIPARPDTAAGAAILTG